MPTLAPEARLLLRGGCAIPAHPLALDRDRRLDERSQRALTRYYLSSGAGGLAVGVHSTEFAIRDPHHGLFEPVLALAAETVQHEASKRVLMVAGACGPVGRAVAETELAASLGYDAVLLSPGGLDDCTEDDLLDRTRAVAGVLPVIGFYLQPAVGGRRLSADYWRRLSQVDGLVAIKMAPFDRYATGEVVRAVCESGRADDVVLYTGNDDAILIDLLVPHAYPIGGRVVTTHVTGGLLGHWAVWTGPAVRMLERARAAREGDNGALRQLLALSPQVTSANAAVFDAGNDFRGCIPGIKQVLHDQGLIDSTVCLDEDEQLSPGQAEAIHHARHAFPWLTDDEFVATHRDLWRA